MNNYKLDEANMKNYIETEKQKIYYSIVRSNRKTIGISISQSHGVKISAPRIVSDRQIAEVVRNKSSWIIEKLSHFEIIKSEVPQRKFTDGEMFLILGKEYPLKIVTHPEMTSSVDISNNCLVVSLSQNICENNSENKTELIRNLIVNWYKKITMEVVSQRINFFSEKLDVTPSNLIIKELKSIWGSCTGKNTININWKIIMAPMSIVDYLVVHELTHIKIKNHSKHFWKLAESILPNYKECSKWLKDNGHKLSL